jgi:hypothetical protein
MMEKEHEVGLGMEEEEEEEGKGKKGKMDGWMDQIFVGISNLHLIDEKLMNEYP